MITASITCQMSCLLLPFSVGSKNACITLLILAIFTLHDTIILILIGCSFVLQCPIQLFYIWIFIAWVSIAFIIMQMWRLWIVILCFAIKVPLLSLHSLYLEHCMFILYLFVLELIYAFSLFVQKFLFSF